MAGPAGVVQRQRRHVRHVVLRLQLAAAGLRAAAGAEGDLRDLRDRRPLDRRRALARRRAAAGRPRRLQPLHDADVRAASRARGLGRGLGGRVAASARDQRAVGADLAAGEHARRLLARRVGAARRGRRRATSGSSARRCWSPGWADGYRNNSFRTVAELAANGVPHRLLAGPWAHADPRPRSPARGSTSTWSWPPGSTAGCGRTDGGRACRDLRVPLRRLRPRLHPARARPGPARGLLGPPAVGPADPAVLRRARRPPLAARAPRHRHRGLDRLRRPPAVGTLHRPAPRRRPLPDLGRRPAVRRRSSASPAPGSGSAPTPPRPRSR